MKRLILLAALALMGMSAAAQDIIIKKSGEQLKVIVTEVTKNEVKYKRYTAPDGPTYSIMKDDIDQIRYQGGNRMTTKKSSDLAQAPKAIPGMKYRQYKDLYKASNYRRQPDDPYHPFWSGVGSFFVPGLGQAFDGQIIRGIFQAGVYGGLIYWASQYDMETQKKELLICSGCMAVWNIFSMFDANIIAKKKNMYFQDNHFFGDASLNVYPSLTYAPATMAGSAGFGSAASSGLRPTPGLTLSLTF